MTKSDRKKLLSSTTQPKKLMIQRTISALKKLEKTGLPKTNIDLEPPFGGNRRLVDSKSAYAALEPENDF